MVNGKSRVSREFVYKAGLNLKSGLSLILCV